MDTNFATETKEEKQERAYVVNCNKCGKSLKVRNDEKAYVCPVCKQILTLKTVKGNKA